MNIEASSDRRQYRMTARAAAATTTGERILDAVIELFWERPGEDFSLADIAERAGVSVRTVIRRFGGRREIMVAAGEREAERVRGQRDQAPVGDVPGAIAVLLDHYEELGDRVLLMLAEERRQPELGPILDQGRASHVDWCERVFAPTLAELAGAERARRLAQFVAVCDVYTWKLLRHDRGLSRDETARALVEMLAPLTKDS